MYTQRGGGIVAKPGFVIDESSRNYRTFSLKVWSFSILESFTNDNKYEYCSTRYILSAQENAAHILTPSPTEGGKVVAVAHLRSALSSKYFFLRNRIFPKFQGFFLRYSMFK